MAEDFSHLVPEETTGQEDFTHLLPGQQPERQEAGPTLEGAGELEIQDPLTLEGRQQQIQRSFEQAGIPLDQDEPADLGFWRRLDVARSGNEEEITTKIQASFPEADVRFVDVPEVGRMAAVKTGDDKFKLVNPAGLGTEDFAPLVAKAPEIGAATLAAYLTGGLSTLAQAIRTGLAAGGVNLLGQAQESLRGVQRETAEEVGMGALWETLLEGSAVGGAGVLNRAVNIGRGSGMAGPEAREIIGAQQRLGMSPISPDRLFENKILQRFAQQSRQTGDVLPSADRRTQREVLSRFQGTVPDPDAQRAGRELRDEIVPGKVAEAKTRILNRQKSPRVTPYQAGGKLRDATIQFEKRTRKERDKLYDDAYRVVPELKTSATFNVSEPQRIAKEALRGKTGIKTTPASTRTEESALVDESGRRITRTVETPEQKRRVQLRSTEVGGDLRAVAEDLANLDPMQEFETVRALRTQLFDIRNKAKLEGMNELEKQANDLYFALKRSMENPDFPEDVSQSFRSKWRKANANNARREELLEKRIMVDIARTEKPAQLANRIMDNPDPEDLQIIRDQLGDDAFSAVKDAYRTRIETDLQFGKADNVLDTLSTMQARDPDSLNLLLSQKEQLIYRDIAHNLKALDKAPIQRALDQQLEAGSVVEELAFREGPEGMNRLINMVGGQGSQGHEALKAGTIDTIFLRSLTKDDKGRFLIDPNKLQSELEAWNQAGTKGSLEALFSPRELQTIKDVELINGIFMRGPPDAGASLEAAASITQLKGVTRGQVSSALSGAHDIFWNKVVGRLLISKPFQKAAVGRGVNPKNFRKSRAFLAGLVQAREGVEQLARAIGEETDDTPRQPQVEEPNLPQEAIGP